MTTPERRIEEALEYCRTEAGRHSNPEALAMAIEDILEPITSEAITSEPTAAQVRAAAWLVHAVEQKGLLPGSTSVDLHDLATRMEALQ